MKIIKRVLSFVMSFILILGSIGCTNGDKRDILNVVDGYEFLFDESLLNQDGFEGITAEMVVDLYESCVPVEYASEGKEIRVDYGGRTFYLTAGNAYKVAGSSDIRVKAYHKEYHPTIVGKVVNYVYAVCNLTTGEVYETNISDQITNLGEASSLDVLISNAKTYMRSRGVDVEGFECKYSANNINIKKVYKEGNTYHSELANTVFFVECVCGIPTPNVYWVRLGSDGAVYEFSIESEEHCGRFPDGVLLDMDAYLRALDTMLCELSGYDNYNYRLKLDHTIVKDSAGNPLIATYVDSLGLRTSNKKSKVIEKSFYVYTPLEVADD